MTKNTVTATESTFDVNAFMSEMPSITGTRKTSETSVQSICIKMLAAASEDTPCTKADILVKVMKHHEDEKKQKANISTMLYDLGKYKVGDKYCRSKEFSGKLRKSEDKKGFWFYSEVTPPVVQEETPKE